MSHLPLWPEIYQYKEGKQTIKQSMAGNCIYRRSPSLAKECGNWWCFQSTGQMQMLERKTWGPPSLWCRHARSWEDLTVEVIILERERGKQKESFRKCKSFYIHQNVAKIVKTRIRSLVTPTPATLATPTPLATPIASPPILWKIENKHYYFFLSVVSFDIISLKE